MVVGKLDNYWVWRGGEVRVEHERSGKGVVGVSGRFVRENKEGIQRHDLEIAIWGRYG